ncbi:MAG: hypothetical protein Q4E62_07420 [Sutterellaceae bacterium]|nr:hypothetical protein [Sutterellaceae bacterium]
MKLKTENVLYLLLFATLDRAIELLLLMAVATFTAVMFQGIPPSLLLLAVWFFAVSVGFTVLVRYMRDTGKGDSK